MVGGFALVYVVRASLGRSTRSPGDFGIEIDLQVLGGVNDGLKLTLEGAKSSLMQVQSEIRSKVGVGNRFLPASEIGDPATLASDYEKLRIAHELSQKLSIESDLDQLLQQIVDETFALIRLPRDGAGWTISILDPEGTMVLSTAGDGFAVVGLGACVPKP